MQSLLQYRRAGLAAQAQLDRDAKKADGSDSQQQHANGGPRASKEEKEEDAQDPMFLEAPSADDGELGRIPPPGSIQQSYTNGTAHTQHPDGDEEAFGPVLTGIDVRNHSGQRGQVFIVGWAGPDDPLMPHNWPLTRRVGVTLQISLIGLFLTAASGIDATVLPQAAKDLGVSHVAESLATGKQARITSLTIELMYHRHRAVSGGNGRRVTRRWAILGDVWSQRRLLGLFSHLHDLDHGFWSCAQLWRSNNLPLPRRLLCFSAARLHRGLYCRHVQQYGEDVELSALCYHLLHGTYARCCHGSLHRPVDGSELALG